MTYARIVIAALVLVGGGLVVACGGDDSGTDTVLDTADTETTGEVAADADADVPPETTPDVPLDVEPDTAPDAEPDTAPDVEPDAAPDVEPDAAPDAEPEATPDVEPETHLETGEDFSETHLETGEGHDGTREDAGTGVSCVDNPTYCETAAECATFSDYTNPDCCSCDPYNVACLPVETPTCTCFVDPCMGHTADCVENRCVVL